MLTASSFLIIDIKIHIQNFVLNSTIIASTNQLIQVLKGKEIKMSKKHATDFEKIIHAGTRNLPESHLLPT